VAAMNATAYRGRTVDMPNPSPYSAGMPSRAGPGFAFLLLAVNLSLAGCGIIPEPAVQLVTDRPEMAAYVDRYNAMQSDVRVEIVYEEVPFQGVLDGKQGDVVIGEWLASPAIMNRFDSLVDLVKPGKIDPSWFYAGLLSMGSRDNRPVLIPISFSLPAVVFYKPALQSELPSMFMPLDLLRTKSGVFTAVDKNGSLSAAGFSPLWYPEFLSASARLFGAHFHPGRNGLPAWDSEKLSKAVDFSRSWIADVNGGPAADKAFSGRVLAQPWYKLLSTKKTLFALVPFRDFFALPEEKRRDLDFRWLSQGTSIPAMDDALFAGVLRSSRNKRGARAFLEWFCTLSVQRSLLEVNQSRRIGVFGISNGFSSLKSINEKDLPLKHPLLLGHIPSENMLIFPDPLPDNWLKVRDEVILPWMGRAAGAEEDQPLEKRLEEWLAAQKKRA